MNEHGDAEERVEIRAFRDALRSMPLDTLSYPDERFGREVCGEAIDALAQGNNGVGCLLVDPSGAIVARGHNEVFGRASAATLTRRWLSWGGSKPTTPRSGT